MRTSFGNFSTLWLCIGYFQNLEYARWSLWFQCTSHRFYAIWVLMKPVEPPLIWKVAVACPVTVSKLSTGRKSWSYAFEAISSSISKRRVEDDPESRCRGFSGETCILAFYTSRISPMGIKTLEDHSWSRLKHQKLGLRSWNREMWRR